MNTWASFFFSLFWYFAMAAVLAVFGWGILQVLYWKKAFPKYTLSNVLIAFGMGVVAMVLLVMGLMVDDSYSYDRVIWPILAVDALVLLANGKRMVRSIKSFFSPGARGELRELAVKYGGLFVLLGIQIEFALRFHMGYLALPTWDPYFWYSYIVLFDTTGNIPLLSYPPGFIITCGFFIAPLSGFYDVYFFLKFLPLFVYLTNNLIMFAIAERLFKAKAALFAFLLLTFAIPYTHYRFTLLMPSNFAVVFGLLVGLLLVETAVGDQDPEALFDVHTAPRLQVATIGSDATERANVADHSDGSDGALNPPVDRHVDPASVSAEIGDAAKNKPIAVLSRVIFGEYAILLGVSLGAIGLFHPVYYLYAILCYACYETWSLCRLVLTSPKKKWVELRAVLIRFPTVLIVHLFVLYAFIAYINHFWSFEALMDDYKNLLF